MTYTTEFSPALNRMAKFNNLVSELDFLAFCWCRYFGYELIKKSEALHELKEALKRVGKLPEPISKILAWHDIMMQAGPTEDIIGKTWHFIHKQFEELRDV